MDYPFDAPLSILAWPEVGKQPLDLACKALSDLSRPEALGPHWPQMNTSEGALAFFASHHCDALMDRASGSLAGGIGSRADDHGAWLYYFLLPAWRGRGVGAPALRLAIQRAMELWAGRQLLARCMESNKRSMSLLQAAGFELETSAAHVDGPLVLRMRGSVAITPWVG